MRYVELFAGAGGMSLGLERAGLSCVAHAELADFPRRVLRHRWPDVPLYGDVTAVDGRALIREHGPVDLLAGGSPCQDMSVAGKRAGLAGARSGLFFEQIRLWDETNATYILWENVAGALSSNCGKDFAAVLSAIVGTTVPVPRDGWGGDESGGGVAAGPRAVAAWRLLDAQYFGVPQRRLRVFVLGARAGGVDPAEVLLEPEGVYRHPPTRREAGEETADSLTVGANQTCGFPCDDVAGEEGNGGVTGTLTSNGDAHRGFRDADGLVISFGWQNSAAQGDDCRSEASASLRAGTVPAVLAFDRPVSPTDFPGDTFVPLHGVAMCLPATGGNNGGGAGQRVVQPLVCLTGDVTHALTHEGHDASGDGTGRGTPIVVGPDDSGLARCVTAGEGKRQDWETTTIVASLGCRSTPDSSMVKGGHDVPALHGIPRRLMPIECERLMSWPDGWTDVPDDNGRPASDAVRYRACGNGVVSNVAEWIAARLTAMHTALECA